MDVVIFISVLFTTVCYVLVQYILYFFFREKVSIIELSKFLGLRMLYLLIVSFILIGTGKLTQYGSIFRVGTILSIPMALIYFFVTTLKIMGIMGHSGRKKIVYTIVNLAITGLLISIILFVFIFLSISSIAKIN